MRAGRERHAGSRAQSHPKVAEPRRVSDIRYKLNDIWASHFQGSSGCAQAGLAALHSLEGSRGHQYRNGGSRERSRRRPRETS